jgi:deoxycytidylate deaminase
VVDDSMGTKLAEGIELLYKERSSPLVFALTGRTGSGCTTAAATLSKSFEDIALGDTLTVDTEARKHDIVRSFARAQWVPFSAITVSSVIFSFLLDEEQPTVEQLLESEKVSSAPREEFLQQLMSLRRDARLDAFQRAVTERASPSEKEDAWNFFASELHVRAQQAKKVLAGNYSPLFQKLGDNIRFSGAAHDSTIRPDRLFRLMERLRSLIDCFVSASTARNQPARIVIDAIRNPLELVYLRRHIPDIYVLAVTVDDDDRQQRLVEMGLTKRQIEDLDKKEYPQSKHLDDYANFVSQNLKDCIQKADVFIANPGSSANFVSSVRRMNAQLVRYVSLALRPGLVSPTRDERCMQMAFVAKLNSGCISRQVGAVVADDKYSVHAIGWNDVPKGQTPCLLRDVGNLLSSQDDAAFSDYERSNTDLHKQLEKDFKNRGSLKQQLGLACPYCFKEAYNTMKRDKNQVHTRSLHAEENAFLQVAKRGGAGLERGVLYTTASPCELCSKKAYQLGIQDIVYVDPYPGISGPHILGSGTADTRPTLRLFNGAIGSAYHRLYEAILSIKDEYKARLST